MSVGDRGVGSGEGEGARGEIQRDKNDVLFYSTGFQKKRVSFPISENTVPSGARVGAPQRGLGRHTV